jgi:predicted kinase
MKRLFLIRGCPGAGKTELLQSLKVDAAFSADDYHTDIDGNYNWKPENSKAGHLWCQTQTMNCMMVEYDIAVANTFTQEWEMEPYFKLAERYGYRVITLIVENRHGGKNIHNVSEDIVTKMKERFEVVL